MFISHAWKYIFLDLLEAIESISTKDNANKDGGPLYFWVDLFSNNQNIGFEPPPFDWWCGTFMNAIQTMNHVVMIIAPWENPYSLTRAWCLWEVYCAIVTKSKFSIAMCKREHVRFKQMILEKTNMFFDMIGSVDLRNSQATNPEDKERIFEVVAKEVGITKLNAMVMKQLREWGLNEMKQFGSFLTEKDRLQKERESLARAGAIGFGWNYYHGDPQAEMKNIEYLLGYVDLLTLNNYLDEAHTELKRVLKSEHLKTKPMIYGKYLIILADCYAMNLSTSDHFRYTLTCMNMKTKNQTIRIYDEGIEIFKNVIETTKPKEIQKDIEQEVRSEQPEILPVNTEMYEKAISWYIRGLIGRAICLWKTDLPFIQSTLELSQQFTGKESLETAKIFIILGKSHFYFGNPELALANYQNALAIYEKIVTKSHPVFLLLELQIALVYPYLMEAQKGYEMIVNCSQKAKEKFELGHPFLNTILQNSMFIYATTGNISVLFHELIFSWLYGTMKVFFESELAKFGVSSPKNSERCVALCFIPGFLLFAIPQMITVIIGMLLIPLFTLVLCLKELVIYLILLPLPKSMKMKVFFWTHREIFPNFNLSILANSIWNSLIYFFLLMGACLFALYAVSFTVSFLLAFFAFLLLFLIFALCCVEIPRKLKPCYSHLKRRKASLLPCFHKS